MGKKRNIIKRNSGFLIGCIILGGVSFVGSEFLITDTIDEKINDKIMEVLKMESETEIVTETEEVSVPEETSEDAAYALNAFAVSSDGSITVIEQQAQENSDSDGQNADTEASGQVPSGEEETENALFAEKPPLENVDFWSDSILPQTAVELINADTLAEFNAAEVHRIKNEIFARHGRMFDEEDLQEYFSQKYWYVPYYTPEEFDANISSLLTEYELKNLEFITQYEASMSQE